MLAFGKDQPRERVGCVLPLFIPGDTQSPGLLLA
jgi:hypothetical protein